MLKFRVFLYGASGVGKTCLLNYFNNKLNPELTVGTVGITFNDCILNIRGEECLFQIVDTCGKEKFSEMNIGLLKNQSLKLAIIFYELSSEDGEQIIDQFLNQINSQYDDAQIAIIGTKLGQGIHENQQNIEKKFWNYKIYQVSTAIEDIFKEIFTQFYDKYESKLPPLSINQSLAHQKPKNKADQMNEQKKNRFWCICYGSD